MALRDYGIEPGRVFTTIFLDPKSSYTFGYDQAYVGCPEVFPTVEFPIAPVKQLIDIAGVIALEKDFGLIPEEEFRFFIGVQNYAPNGIDTSITVEIPSNGIAPDLIYIDLSDEEQKIIRRLLEAYAIHFYGETVDELLSDAARAIPVDVVDMFDIMT